MINPQSSHQSYGIISVFSEFIKSLSETVISQNSLKVSGIWQNSYIRILTVTYSPSSLVLEDIIRGYFNYNYNLQQSNIPLSKDLLHVIYML